MKNRERVNYQTKDFSDPYSENVLNHVTTYICEGKIQKLFEFYNQSKNYTIYFDLDHSILAIPYKKLISTYKRIENSLDLTDKYKRKIISILILMRDLNISKSDLQKLVN